MRNMITELINEVLQQVIDGRDKIVSDVELYAQMGVTFGG